MKTYKWIRNALIVLVAAVVVTCVVVFAIQRAREVAQQRHCAENLKRLGEACAMYQADWHDVLVPYGAPFAWDSNGMWPELLDIYLKRILMSPDELLHRRRVFKCPTDRAEEYSHSSRSYGMNQECGGWMLKEKPVVVQLSSVRYLGRTIRIAEVMWEAQGGSFFAARPSDFNPYDPKWHRFPTWHQGRGNVLWIDGHVSAMTLEQYNMRDKGPYDGNIWLRLEGPKPPVP